MNFLTIYWLAIFSHQLTLFEDIVYASPVSKAILSLGTKVDTCYECAHLYPAVSSLAEKKQGNHSVSYNSESCLPVENNRFSSSLHYTVHWWDDTNEILLHHCKTSLIHRSSPGKCCKYCWDDSSLKKKKKSIKLFLGFCFYISSCCLDCKDMGKQLQVLTFFSLG